jgi:hypothetical protein
VASHVGYERHTDPNLTTEEQFISNKSPLISFSSDLSKAGFFMDRTEKVKLHQSSLDDATHFLWVLDSIDCKKNSDGWFSFSYTASVQNVETFLKQDFANLNSRGHEMEMDELGPLLGSLIVTANTRSDNSPHYADLIDVVTFLKNTDTSNIDAELVKRAIDRATESAEWLLFPKDPFLTGGFDSRFTLNKYLKLHYWATRIKNK